MVLVAVAAVSLALLIYLRRFVAGKVAEFMEQVRDRAGLPRDVSLSDFDVPVSKDAMNWILFDAFLSRFWPVLLAFVVVLTWVTLAFFPVRSVRANTAATGSEK
jgi:hypothetical protein